MLSTCTRSLCYRVARPYVRSLPSSGTRAYSTPSHLSDTPKHWKECEPSSTTGKDYTMPHPIWSKEDLHTVQITHRPPQTLIDRLAYWSVFMLRSGSWTKITSLTFLGFDLATGYKFAKLTEERCLTRIIFLETLAAVPGMMGAMVRHLNSLRTMKRDYGWIHTLLEEAENERMHLLTAMYVLVSGWTRGSCCLSSYGFVSSRLVCWYWSMLVLAGSFGIDPSLGNWRTPALSCVLL